MYTDPPLGGGATLNPPDQSSNLHQDLREYDRSAIREILQRDDRERTSIIQELLRFGTDRLNVQNGQLNRIRPGPGTHTFKEVVHPLPCVQKGTTQDLGRTYCRKIIASGGVLALHDAPNQGWEEDPAYQFFTLPCYIGAKVRIESGLYGTVCFADSTARETPFTDVERALVRSLASSIGRLLPAPTTDADATSSRNSDKAGNEKKDSFLRRVQKASRTGGWELDLTTGDLRWTQQTYRLLDLPPDYEPSHSSTLNFVTKEHRPSLQNAVRRCQEKGVSFERDVLLQTAQGSQRWVRVRGAPQYEDDTVVRITGTIRPITVEHELASELSLVRSQFRQLVEHASPIVFMLDADGTILVSEGADLDALNLVPGEAVGASIYELYAHEPEVIALTERALSGESVKSTVEIQGRTFDIWFAPTHDATGTITGGVGMAADITPRKQAEQALATERDRFATLFEALPTPVVRCTVQDGETAVISAANAAFESCFGTEASTLIGTELDSLIVPEKHQEEASAITRRALREGSFQKEVQRQTTDGLRDFELQIAAQRRPEAPPELYVIYTDITERKEREQALRTERDLLRRVFETSPTAIIIVDANGEFVRVSNRAQQILGYEDEKLTKRTFNDPEWDIRSPNGSPMDADQLPFAQVRSSNEPIFGVEHTVQWPDGTRRLLSVNGAPLIDAEGTFLGAVFHLEDITEQRKVKHNLQESEQRFRGIFQNAALGIALVNKEGQILEANPTLESMLGVDAPSLRGRSIQTFTHPDDELKEQSLFDELVAGTRDRYQVEKRYEGASGEVFWGRWTVSRQDGPDGMQIVAMVEDVDEEKRRKQQLRLFQKMAEQAHDAILLSESEPLAPPGPKVLYANAAFTEMTGYEKQEIRGRTYSLLHGPDTDPVTLERQAAQLSKGESFVGETVNYRKDGTPFVNRWNVAPVRNEEGKMTHLVSVQRDVTEQRRMQERLLEIQEEERRRIDQEIHDEMGGLLTSLQMMLDLAQQKAPNEGSLDKELEQAVDLVDNLSSTARTISRKLYPGSLSTEGLDNALPTIIQELEAHHGLEVSLQTDLKDNNPHRSSLVERTACWVVCEALFNVARHAETDTARVVVTSMNEHLQAHVIDEGCGFDPDSLSREETLGLEGIRRRIHRLNGEFDLDTAPGEGTRVSATLPLTIATVPGNTDY